MRVTLKDSAWEREGETLVVVCNPSMRIELYDPDGPAETMLGALAGHEYTVADLPNALAGVGLVVSTREAAAAVRALDELRLPQNADERSLGDEAEDERYLGTGGLGSNVVQNLAGLGVGQLTLLDCDTDEPRNSATSRPCATSPAWCSCVPTSTESSSPQPDAATSGGSRACSCARRSAASRRTNSPNSTAPTGATDEPAAGSGGSTWAERSPWPATSRCSCSPS